MCCKTSLALSFHSSCLRKLFVAFPTMVVLSEIVHLRGFGFLPQKQVCVLHKDPNGKLEGVFVMAQCVLEKRFLQAEAFSVFRRGTAFQIYALPRNKLCRAL